MINLELQQPRLLLHSLRQQCARRGGELIVFERNTRKRLKIRQRLRQHAAAFIIKAIVSQIQRLQRRNALQSCEQLGQGSPNQP